MPELFIPSLSHIMLQQHNSVVNAVPGEKVVISAYMYCDDLSV